MFNNNRYLYNTEYLKVNDVVFDELKNHDGIAIEGLVDTPENINAFCDWLLSYTSFKHFTKWNVFSFLKKRNNVKIITGKVLNKTFKLTPKSGYLKNITIVVIPGNYIKNFDSLAEPIKKFNSENKIQIKLWSNILKNLNGVL